MHRERREGERREKNETERGFRINLEERGKREEEKLSFRVLFVCCWL
jgi:hypothetical protein